MGHRFSGIGEGAVVVKLDPELKTLVDQYSEVVHVLEKARPAASLPSPPKDVAWEVLVKRAVLGVAETHETHGRCLPGSQQFVEDLMREVERWSLELQRHCPEDWNQFSAVLVHALPEARQKSMLPNSRCNACS